MVAVDVQRLVKHLVLRHDAHRAVRVDALDDARQILQVALRDHHLVARSEVLVARPARALPERRRERLQVRLRAARTVARAAVFAAPRLRLRRLLAGGVTLQLVQRRRLRELAGDEGDGLDVVPVLELVLAAKHINDVAHASVLAPALEREVVLARLRLGEETRGRAHGAILLGAAGGGALLLGLQVRVVEAGHQFHGALVVRIVGVDDAREVALVHAAAHAHPRADDDVLHLLLGDGDGVHHLLDRHEADGLHVVHVTHPRQGFLDVVLALSLDVDVRLEVVLRGGGHDGHRALARLAHVDRLLHEAHDSLALLALLHRDHPQLGVTHRGVQRLLIHRVRHAVPFVLVPVRGVPLLESFLELLLVFQTFHVLHVLVPSVDALLRLELDRLALAVVQLLRLAVEVALVVGNLVVVLHLGDVVDERRRAGGLLGLLRGLLGILLRSLLLGLLLVRIGLVILLSDVVHELVTLARLLRFLRVVRLGLICVLLVVLVVRGVLVRVVVVVVVAVVILLVRVLVLLLLLGLRGLLLGLFLLRGAHLLRHRLGELAVGHAHHGDGAGSPSDDPIADRLGLISREREAVDPAPGAETSDSGSAR